MVWSFLENDIYILNGGNIMEQQISNVYEFKVKKKLVVGILLTLAGLIMFLSFFLLESEWNWGLLFWSILCVIGGIWSLKEWYFSRGKIELNNNGLIFHGGGNSKDNKMG
jgi:hypothetical protein